MLNRGCRAEWERAKYLLDLHAPIPAQPNCLRTFRFFQPPEIKLEILVVQID
jgi:hypothetical protein